MFYIHELKPQTNKNYVILTDKDKHFLKEWGN